MISSWLLKQASNIQEQFKPAPQGNATVDAEKINVEILGNEVTPVERFARGLA